MKYPDDTWPFTENYLKAFWLNSTLKRLLILVDWFDPAYKAGGPVRSCVNMVRALESHFEIYVLTSDSDIDGELTSIANKDIWLPYSRFAKVMYLSSAARSLKKIEAEYKTVRPDGIILNSMFSRVFSLYPLLLKKLGKIDCRLLIFPRGMLKPSALSHKANKKKLFFSLARPLYLARENVFVATDVEEVNEIKIMFPGAKAQLAANFSDNTSRTLILTGKEPGFLKMLFIGRIHPIKNLKFLLDILADSNIRGSLKIIGVLEDRAYWQECSAVIDTITGIEVNYLSELPHDKLYDHIADSHLFVLPTCGENFGHAIAESLSMGRPVLISDQTPWKNLKESQLGWEYPLSNKALFQQSLKIAEQWTGDEFDGICKSCFNWYTERRNEHKLIEQYKNILHNVPIGN